jgi:hypothetical protein
MPEKKCDGIPRPLFCQPVKLTGVTVSLLNLRA